MQLHAIYLSTLLLMQELSTADAVQIARVIPSSPDDTALNYRHYVYIDQRVQADPRAMLNHKGWHLRRVTTSPPITAPFLGNSAMTGTVPMQDIRASSTANLESPRPQALSMKEGLQRQEGNASWDRTTEAACMDALSGLDGVASNPSGMAACYNTQSLDNITGIFSADLRIYQVSAPTGDWLRTTDDGIRLGLNYVHASVTQKSTTKRVQESYPSNEEVRNVFGRRSNRNPLRKFGDLALAGRLTTDGLGILSDSTAHAILGPKIRLSTTVQDGTPIMTTLSLQDASFVNGLFTDQAQIYNANITTISNELTDTAASISSANKVTVFPVGLITTSVWALVLISTTGYGIAVRTMARNRYRRELKAGCGVGPSVISWQ